MRLKKNEMNTYKRLVDELSGTFTGMELGNVTADNITVEQVEKIRELLLLQHRITLKFGPLVEGKNWTFATHNDKLWVYNKNELPKDADLTYHTWDYDEQGNWVRKDSTEFGKFE